MPGRDSEGCVEDSALLKTTSAQLIETAFQCHRAGNMVEAEQLYRQVLALDPLNFAALKLLGLLAYQSDRGCAAAEPVGTVLHSTSSPAAFNALGQACREHFRLEEAAWCYHEAIMLKSDYVPAYNNLGAVQQESGRAADAERTYRKALAIRPDAAEVYCNLAKALQDLGRIDEAEQACRQAIGLYPGLAAAYAILGTVLRTQGRLEEAEQACVRAVALQPHNAMTHNNLGTILHALGRPAEAEQACRRAVEINPRLVMAHTNLGAILRTLARPEESEQVLRHALFLAPGHAGALDNLAVTLKEQGRLDEAKELCLRALAVNPGSAHAYNNLGVICKESGAFAEAVGAFSRALVLLPENGEAQWNLGLLNLLHGNFMAGWRGYEWRFSIRKDPHGQLAIPRYDGTDLTGKTVFVYAEQATGEELMFSSCLGDVAAHAAHCLVECDARLVPLFSRSFPSLSCIPATGCDDAALLSALPRVDFKLPLGSLPQYYRNSRDDFTGRRAWLVASPEARHKWRSRYNALGDALMVGIAWRGGIKTELSRQRSTTLDQWRGLFAVPGVRFVNLQYGDCREEFRELKQECETQIHSWEDADQLRDLDDFAAQVAALDLVITIDNTTAHMAGALGTPVWCLVPHVPNWRWMLDCENSPWYPTMRLFRQKRRHDWQSVFGSVARQLALLRDELRVTQSGVPAEPVLYRHYSGHTPPQASCEARR